MKNYYEILGVQNDASIECIKEAYRKLAKKFHPDLNGGDNFFVHHFRQIQEAYDTLSSEVKRKIYDTDSPKKEVSALSVEIENKILAYRKQNELFRQQKINEKGLQNNPRKAFHPSRLKGRWLLIGVIAFITLTGTLLLFLNPHLPLGDLLYLLLKIIFEGLSLGVFIAVGLIAIWYFTRKIK